MKDEKTWDWQTEKKEIPVKEWQDSYNWVEEFHVSPDGEKIAAIVNMDEAEFSICMNGETWEETLEKAWALRFLPDGRLVALVANDEEWTVCVDGTSWEERFDYIWDLKSSSDGSFIGAAVQLEGRYGMVVNDKTWDTLYDSISGVVLNNNGASAGVVQVLPMGQGDIDGFKDGLFSVAVDSIAQSEKFMNVWDLSFDSKGDKIAGSIRKNRVDYSIYKDNQAWNKNFQFSWKPEFINNDNSLIAPVREDGKWVLVKDESLFWKNSYGQLWKLALYGDGQKIAAIVSDNFGKWTVSENDKVWNVKCDSMISNLYYSNSGDSLVALFKYKDYFDVVVNDKSWNIRADKLWSPVVSSNDEVIATRMEKDGKFYLVVNGKVYKEAFDMVFKPKIGPDNDKILLKAIQNGIYIRQILSLENVL
jgi:hypothetical protein